MKTTSQKRILIISGPTGVGESSITNEIIKLFPVFTRLVTATTRKPRLQEKNKRDYYFFSTKKFKNEIKKGNIIEYTFIKNRKVYYGSFAPDLNKKLAKGYNIIINPDVVGTKFYKKNYDAVAVFISPGSIKNIKMRILGRDQNILAEELQKRLNNAKEEIKKESCFYDYIVVNHQNQLDEAVKKIIIIIKNEGFNLKARVDKNK